MHMHHVGPNQNQHRTKVGMDKKRGEKKKKGQVYRSRKLLQNVGFPFLGTAEILHIQLFPLLGTAEILHI